MARKGKSGLDYFPMDIDFFSDEKIEFVSAKFGTISELIPIKLLMRIYRKGYFIDWDEDVCILFSKKFGDDITFNLLNDVVFELIKREFFSHEMYEDFGILTSKGIQKRFLEATKRRKEIQVFGEYLLLKEIDVNILNQNVNIIPLSDCKSTQSKVKRKKRESKEKVEKTFVDSDESTSHQDSLFPDGELFKGEHVVKTESEKAESFFEEVWKDYPKKSGKSEITITQKKTIFKLGDEFKRAMKRYSDFLEAEKGRGFNRPPVDGKKFFKKAYVDYLDSNYVKEDLQEDEEDALKGTIYDPEYAHLWADQEGIRK